MPGISYSFKEGAPRVVITMGGTNTEKTNSESKYCFVCGKPLTGDYATYAGIGDHCLKCAKAAEEYANSLRGRGFHGPR